VIQNNDLKHISTDEGSLGAVGLNDIHTTLPQSHPECCRSGFNITFENVEVSNNAYSDGFTEFLVTYPSNDDMTYTNITDENNQKVL
jgi:hypothetical protein